MKPLIPFDMTMEASQAAASIAIPQRQSRMGEPSEFQKGITVGMNIKDASNREIGRRLEMDRNEATVLVRAFLKGYQGGEHRKSWKTYKD